MDKKKWLDMAVDLVIGGKELLLKFLKHNNQIKPSTKSETNDSVAVLKKGAEIRRKIMSTTNHFVQSVIAGEKSHTIICPYKDKNPYWGRIHAEVRYLFESERLIVKFVGSDSVCSAHRNTKLLRSKLECIQKGFCVAMHMSGVEIKMSYRETSTDEHTYATSGIPCKNFVEIAIIVAAVYHSLYE